MKNKLLQYKTMKWNKMNYIYENEMKMENDNEYEHSIYVHSHFVLNTTLGK